MRCSVLNIYMEIWELQMVLQMLNLFSRGMKKESAVWQNGGWKYFKEIKNPP